MKHLCRGVIRPGTDPLDLGLSGTGLSIPGWGGGGIPPFIIPEMII